MMMIMAVTGKENLAYVIRVQMYQLHTWGAASWGHEHIWLYKAYASLPSSRAPCIKATTQVGWPRQKSNV